MAAGVLVVLAVMLLDLLALARGLRLIAAVGVVAACLAGAAASRRVADRSVLAVLGGIALLLAVAAAARLRPAPWVFVLYGPTLAALAVACYRLWRMLKDGREAEAERRRVRLLDVEQERARLARELHDDPLQQVASAVFQLDRAAKAVQPADVRACIGLAQDSLAEVLLAIRALLDDLAPPDLHRYGLAGSLEMLVERVRAVADGDVRLDVEVPAGSPPLPRVVALAGYRIVQQATGNALRHADADLVSVSLAQTPARLRLSVADDGRGFDDAELSPGHGLRTMRENAEVAGGQLKLDTEPGRGCTVLLTIPLATATQADAGHDDT